MKLMRLIVIYTFLTFFTEKDFIRETLPREIIDLIIFYMTKQAKRLLRSTNKYWFGYIKMDKFTIYFARPKTLPDIVDHFQRQYGDKPIGIKLDKIVMAKVEQYPVQHLVTLTNLTSLSFKFSRGSLASLKNTPALTSLTNILNLSSMHINDGKFLNLTALSTSNTDTIKLYTNLRQLVCSFYQYTGNPFALVANPSKLTSIDIGISQLEGLQDSANLLTQFKNLKSYKHYQIASGTLPRIFQYLTGLERLEIWRGTPQDDIFLLTRLTYLSVALREQIDILTQRTLLPNLKCLLIPHFTTEDGYAILSSLKTLEELKFSYSPVGQSIVVDGLKYINSEKLTRLVLDYTSEHLNMDHLSTLTTLQELQIAESMTERIQKSYDALTGLTNLTKLSIQTQTPASIRFTVLNDLVQLKDLNFSGNYDFHTCVHSDLTFSSLTNLDSLTIGCCAVQTIYNGLSHLTQLTSVNINLSPPAFEQNPSLLGQLTNLRKLIFVKQVPTAGLWDVVTCLTNLEQLDVWRVDSEEVLESFSVLTNLTELRINRSHKIKGIHLTKLTSLQALSFISKPARKLYEKDHSLIEKLTRLKFKEFRS